MHSSFTGSGKVGPKHTNLKTDVYKLIHLLWYLIGRKATSSPKHSASPAYPNTQVSFYQSVSLPMEPQVGLGLRSAFATGCQGGLWLPPGLCWPEGPVSPHEGPPVAESPNFDHVKPPPPPTPPRTLQRPQAFEKKTAVGHFPLHCGPSHAQLAPQPTVGSRGPPAAKPLFSGGVFPHLLGLLGPKRLEGEGRGRGRGPSHI